jgi:spore coat protein H
MRTILSVLLFAACNDAITEQATDTTDSSDTLSCPVDLTATGWSEATHQKGTDGDYGLLFDDLAVQRIDITLCEGDHAAMLDDLTSLYGAVGDGGGPGAGGGPPGGGGGPPEGGGDGGPPEDAADNPIYVPVMVAFEGQSWPAVGMRYKGNSSLQQAWQAGSTKLPFRLNFDYYEDDYSEVDNQRFHGFKELKFSSGFGDDSLVRDKVSADLFREAGIGAAKGSLFEIYVDIGEGPVYWGAYTMFEDPCGELLDSWFGDDDGSCYKADGDGAALASFDADSFEDKTNDDTAAAPIQALVETLNDDSSDADAWRAGLESVLDVDGFLRTLAVNNLIGNWDSYGLMTHNYYLYADPAQDGRLVWVPWDLNLSYAASNIRTPLSISMDEVSDDWPLIRRLMDDPVYADAYYSHVAELLDGPLSAQAQQDRFQTAHDLIADSARAESGSYTNISDSFDDALESTNDAVFGWISDATTEAEAELSLR